MFLFCLVLFQEVVAAVNRVEAFQFDHKVIATPEKVNTVQDAGITSC